MAKKNQSSRLTKQHKKSQGVVGIFGRGAKLHDLTVGEVAQLLAKNLVEKYPQLSFRFRKNVQKSEINLELQSIDDELGQSIFVPGASIRPDGGLVEVEDDNGKWRVILVTEAKHQGKDVENILKGQLVGKNNDQDLMDAGNAIERSHKILRRLLT